MAEIGDYLYLGRGARISVSVLTWRFSGSGGPGGQHANTSNTRVEVIFDIAGDTELPSDVRLRLTKRFGDVHSVTCSDGRSQWQNRRIALMRLQEQLNDANKVAKRRRPTKPTRGSQRRRMDSKTKRGQTKRLRARPDATD